MSEDPEERFIPDDLDFEILEALTRQPELEYKQIAKSLRVDQRTIAKRILIMKKERVLIPAIEIGWGKLGIGASAYVGSTTAPNERDIVKLNQFIREDPRVIEAYKTIGGHQYLLRIVDTDIQKLRDSVLHDLEPLTADLVTSLVSSTVKERDYASFVRFLKSERRAKHDRTR